MWNCYSQQLPCASESKNFSITKFPQLLNFYGLVSSLGLSRLQAITGAASTRLRPILMTTATTVFGHFPLVLARGPGAGARNSIGIMLVSGMIIETAFTLFVVPSIYMLVAKTHAPIRSEDEEEIIVGEPVESVA